MITNALISTLSSVLNALVGLLPTGGSLPSSINDALDYFIPIWSGWTLVVPALDTLLTILLLGVTIEAAIFTYGGINWTINKLRGSG